METSESLVISLKDSVKLENRDHDCSSRNELLNANMVAIADGVGSFTNAGDTSNHIISSVKDIFKKAEEEDELDLQIIFEKAARSLDFFVNSKDEDSKQVPEKSYGTTCICAIETRNSFKLGYTGNGAILHLKGNFIDFPEDIYYLCWCLNNYLNPHTVPENGKEALYKYFSYGAQPAQYSPTIIELTKDKHESGDIIIVCSDGIYSSDHNKVGKDKNGVVWLKVNKVLLLLIHKLRSYIKEHEDYNSKTLEHTMQDFLKELKETPGAMDDDCSLGIIITEQALSYFKKRQRDAGHKS